MSENFNKDRVMQNIFVLKALKENNFNPRVLKQYSGWGGLREAIYTPDIYRQLKKFLREDEIKSIKSTLKTAYFTPKPLVEFIYKAIFCMASSMPNKILEPSIGHGTFIEHMPEKLRKSAKISGVEIDDVSCDLLEKLYPNIDVNHSGFESFNPNEKFDLIVGNPPFGQFFVKDNVHSDISEFSIHHYFVAKCARMLEEGGIIAMILPRYFLDNVKKHVRKIIHKEGCSLIAAYRLPDDLFDDAKVTVDVVFLKKEPNSNTDWLYARKYCRGDDIAYMNNYFLNHPENIIGKIDFIEVYGRTEITCKKNSDTVGELFKRLDVYKQKNNHSLNSKFSSYIQDRIKELQLLISPLEQEKNLLLEMCETFL